MDWKSTYRLAQVLAGAQGLPGQAARPVDVLVGDAGGRVHAVHDDVGALGGDELVQVVLGGGLLRERVEQALDQPAAQGAVAVHLAARPVLQVRQREDITPGGLHDHRAPLRLQGPDGLLGLVAPQREQDHPARPLGQQPPGHRLAHEAVATENQDVPAPDVHGPLGV
jgi:hypothetical protein